MNTPVALHSKKVSAAIVLLAAATILQGSSVPDVELRDPSGNRRAQAKITQRAGQLWLHLRAGTMRRGLYRARLSRARECYVAGIPETIAESNPFEIIGDGLAPAEVLLPGISQKGGLLQLIDQGGLVLETLMASENQAEVCGKVERWFSPGRDIRRGNGPRSR
jgi:hypothetical protein